MSDSTSAMATIENSSQSSSFSEESVKAIKYVNFAELRMKQKKFSGAIEFFGKAIKIEPSAELFVKRAKCHLILKDMYNALNDADYALAMDNRCAEAYIVKANCHQVAGQYEEAEELINEAIILDKKYETEASDNRKESLLKMECDESLVSKIAAETDSVEEAIHRMIALEEEQENTSLSIDINCASVTIRKRADSGLQGILKKTSDIDKSSVDMSTYKSRRPPINVDDPAITRAAEAVKKVTLLDPQKVPVNKSNILKTKTSLTNENKCVMNVPRSKPEINTEDLGALAEINYYNKKGDLIINDEDRILPANIIGYHGVYIRGLSKDIKNSEVKKVFQQFGVVRMVIMKVRRDKQRAYIYFENPESPRHAIKTYMGVVDPVLSAPKTQLVLRFIPANHQPRRMEWLGDQARRTWTSNECYYWRRNGCDRQVRECHREHYPICRGIDFQGWMTEDVVY